MGRGKKNVMVLSIVVVVVGLLVVGSRGSMEDDEKECADQLTNLAACIPFVSGTAKKPTQQCCQDTQKVKSSNPKCLCVLIKESTDPSLGLPVNTTLALQMPSACNIDASVSNCPTLLSLSPDSADAKIFKGADSSSADSPPASANSATASTSTSSSSSSSSPSAGSSSASDSKATPASSGGNSELFGSGSSSLLMVAAAAAAASIAWMFISIPN